MPVPTVPPTERPESTSDVRSSAGAGARPTFLGAAALVLLSRLPFLGPGYGLDADAWRVAWAARVFATTGVYESSRAPGYPGKMPEYALSLWEKAHEIFRDRL